MLRDRCTIFVKDLLYRKRSGMPTHELSEDLVAFVIAEIGRAAGDGKLDHTYPLCLYFETEEERKELVSALLAVKPNMRAKPI